MASTMNRRSAGPMGGGQQVHRPWAFEAWGPNQKYVVYTLYIYRCTTSAFYFLRLCEGRPRDTIGGLEVAGRSRGCRAAANSRSGDLTAVCWPAAAAALHAATHTQTHNTTIDRNSQILLAVVRSRYSLVCRPETCSLRKTPVSRKSPINQSGS